MKDLRAVVGIAGAVGIAIAIGLGLLLRGGDEPSFEATPEVRVPSENSSDLTALRAELEFERAARAAMAEEIVRLEAELETARQAAQRAIEARVTKARVETGDSTEDESDKLFFDEGALRTAGLGEDEIAELRRHFARGELDEIALRDRATRYGWEEKMRFANELYQLREANRQRMSEEQYDWMLYASGRPNRITINDMLPGGKAESAGIQRGDVILRYDGERVHDPVAFNRSTSLDEQDGTVDVEVMRDGTVLHFRLSRGQLGARFGGNTVAPSN